MLSTKLPSALRSLAAAACVSILVAGTAAAQTLTLTDANAATLRGGTYATTNFGASGILETRASGDASYMRRALLKFDTNTTIAQGTPISKATLTVTVGTGSDAETRTLSAYHVTSSYDESVVTWNMRKSSTAWSQPGGDLGARYATATITGTAYSKVTFDVTALVQAIVRGDFGSSRYTRIMLMDEGASSKTSYKQLFSDEASDVTTRPTLTVVTGTSTTTTSTSTSTSSTAKTLRVLQWNTHHGGVGTDGVYDPNRLATWAAKMTPDVIMFNEIEKNDYWGNQDQPALYQSLLQQKTGKTWYYVFAQEYGQWTSNGKGNLILSTYPLNSVNRYELVNNYDRSIAMVNVTVNGRSISFLLTHLDPYDSTLRLTQATEVTNWASNEPENRILTGDMNAWPDQTSIAYYDQNYYDSWVVATNNGTAVAFSGNNGETKSGRIDYIFYSKRSANLTVMSSQVYDTRDANGIMPSDHRPVVTTFAVN